MQWTGLIYSGPVTPNAGFILHSVQGVPDVPGVPRASNIPSEYRSRTEFFRGGMALALSARIQAGKNSVKP